jgi:hypothetical protein
MEEFIASKCIQKFNMSSLTHSSELQFENVGKRAALLSLIEISLGSLIHAMHVPFGGHVLSLNQGLLLSRAAIDFQNSRSVLYISNSAAILKSLSPAGKTLGPMLAISVQGHLFWLGIVTFGNRFLGHALGMVLLSLWGFIQPIGIYLIIYGDALLEMISFYRGELNRLFTVSDELLWVLLFSIVTIKCVLGIVVAWFSNYRLTSDFSDRYQQWIRTKQKSTPMPGAIKANSTQHKNHFYAALQDLKSPAFLASWAFMILFFTFKTSSKVQLIWEILRPIAIAYLIFLMMRMLPKSNRFQAWVSKIKIRNPAFAKTLNFAIRDYTNTSDDSNPSHRESHSTPDTAAKNKID